MARNKGRRASGRGGATNSQNGNGARKSGGRGGRDGAKDNAKLYRDLCDLVRRNSVELRGGHASAAGRAAHDQREAAALGFRGLTPRSLGGRHVGALVADWNARGL